jgi:hypothetical protein
MPATHIESSSSLIPGELRSCLGGRKSDEKWYKTAVPRAERIYKQYVDEITKEGLI